MTEPTQEGHFLIGNLPEGKFAAVATSSPYFCFRADTEQAVLAKVEAAMAFYFSVDRHARRSGPRHTATFITLSNMRTVRFEKEYKHV